MSKKISFDTTVVNKPDKPKMFMVTLHNDDYTTMDFVVMILMKIFKKSLTEANVIMMSVHKNGQCDVDTYIYDIAVTKKIQVQQLAEERGYPLKITLREVLA